MQFTIILMSFPFLQVSVSTGCVGQNGPVRYFTEEWARVFGEGVERKSIESDNGTLVSCSIWIRTYSFFIRLLGSLQRARYIDSHIAENEAQRQCERCQQPIYPTWRSKGKQRLHGNWFRDGYDLLLV